MRQTFFIPGRFAGQNETNNANRTHWAAGAKAKKVEQQTIMWAIKSARLAPVENYPVTVRFLWKEPNRRRDPDNIVSAKKVILDALVQEGILRKDGWDEIAQFVESWAVDKKDPGVAVMIEEV